MIIHLFILSSAAQIYDFQIFTSHLLYKYILTNSHNNQLPVGLIAQLVEHCTGIAEVMGFRIPFKPGLSCVYNYDDHSPIHEIHLYFFILFCKLLELKYP